MQNIDDLIIQFSDIADRVGSALSSMQSIVADGRIPSTGSVQTLEKDLSELQEKYHCIRQAAYEAADGEDLGEELSVNEYADIVHSSAAVKMKAQMEQAASCLKRFVSIRSAVQIFEDALRSYQDAAKALLDKLGGDEGGESLLDEVVPSQLFLQAMEIEDFSSEAGMMLMDQIEKHYCTKVQRGLLLKKYYIPDISMEEQPEKEVKISPYAAAVQTEQTPVMEAVENIVGNSSAETKKAEIPDALMPDETLHSHLEEMLPETKQQPEMVQAKNKIRQGNPSASKFKNQITPRRETATILPLFTHLGVLTAKQVLGFGICMDYFQNTDEVKDAVTRSLSFLVNKGILAEYDMEGMNDSVYCLSHYGYSSLMKKAIAVDMRSFFSMSMGKYCFIGSSSMDANALASASMHSSMLLTYLKCAKQIHDGEDDFAWIKGEVVWQGNYFLTGVIAAGEKYQCALLPSSSMGNGFDKEAISADSVLMLSSHTEFPIFNKEPSHKVFACDGEALFVWADASWQQVMTESAGDSDAEDHGKKQTSDPSRMQEDFSDMAEETAADDIQPAVMEQIVPESATAAWDTGEKSKSEADISSIVSEERNHLRLEEEPEDMPDDGTVQWLCSSLLHHSISPKDQDFEELIRRLLHQDTPDAGILDALLVAQAASFGNENHITQAIHRQLELAVNVKKSNEPYTGENMASVFDEEFETTESCKLAAFAYAMAFPGQPYDHTLHGYTQALVKNFDHEFPSYAVLKPLFHKLSEIYDASQEGFSNRILDQLSDHDKSAAYAEKLKKQAVYLLNEPRVNAHIAGIPELLSSFFGKKSDLYYCLSLVAEDHKEEREAAVALLSEYCDPGDKLGSVLSREVQEQRIDEEWKKATKGKKTSNIPLRYEARKQVSDALKQRLELIRDWAGYGANDLTADISELRRIKQKVLKEIDQALAGMEITGDVAYKEIVLRMLHTIKDKLNGSEPAGFAYHQLLHTGVISLDQDGLPILDKDLNAVKYAEPWRSVLTHILAPKEDFDQVRKAIFDSSSEMFDNLHQLELIGRQLGSNNEIYMISPAQLKEAIEAANVEMEHFHDSLELAYTYNRLYEAEKETLSALVDEHQDRFYERRDFGCWRQYLKNLQRQVKDISVQRRHDLEIRLQNCKKQLMPEGKSSLLEKARCLLEEEENFAVAEEYLNRFEAGERELTEELSVALHDPDSFSLFLSDDVFTPLYDECIRKMGTSSLSKFGTSYVSARFPNDWSSRHKDDSKKLLSNWPSRHGCTSPQKIAAFVAGLGFACRGGEVLEKINRQEVYRIQVEPTAKNMPDYLHPIAALGTQIKTSLNVVVLYGKKVAQELVDTMCSLNLGGISIVLIDYPLDRSVRRQIAEIFRTRTSGQNPFLMIDQVLALHLAMHQDTERLPLMLKCTLPYTCYQPFVRDGGSTADEMFFGRASELATIIDPNGACVVYGGRQLGKTALLERAESLFSKPKAKTYAVYSSILKMSSEAEVVERLTEAINKKTPLKISMDSTIKSLCSQIDMLFRNGTINSMLLLIDESDEFLRSISNDDYMPLRPLVDLKRESKNRFKFVLAGLHNVCRAKNATEKNGIFGQLGQPLCVKPLSPTDALQLISRPLRYLGFQVDRYPHLETILTNTNYYPGILQFFGYTLVHTMTNQYGKYYRAVDGHPPYTLKKEQLGAILNSADLNSSIKEKFRWSLELDPRYFMLARCIVMLYYENSGDSETVQSGYSPEQIIATAVDFDIHCLTKENQQSITVLLDEMVDMGILSRPSETTKRYRLRRRSFINIIGADFDTLWNDIMENNREVR